jgi:hypothetical protein
MSNHINEILFALTDSEVEFVVAEVLLPFFTESSG